MVSAVEVQQREFQEVMKKELDIYLNKRLKPGRSEQKSFAQFQHFEQQLSNRVGERMTEYAQAFGLDTLPADAVAGRAHLQGSGALSTHLEELEEELRQRTVEADSLRNQVLQRQKAASDESLRHCNEGVLHSRAHAFSCADEDMGPEASATKQDTIQRHLKQIENVLNHTHTISSAVDKERESCRRIEEQIRRVNYMESHLMQPIGHGARDATTAMDEDGENDFVAAEVERNEKMSKRMQRQFDGSL